MSLNYPPLTPYLIVHDVKSLMDFVTQILGGKVKMEPKLREDGSLMHAEMLIGDSLLMMGEPTNNDESMPGSFYVMVDDAHGAYSKALEMGCESIMEVTDMEHGHRYGGVKDSNGNRWWMAQEIL